MKALQQLNELADNVKRLKYPNIPTQWLPASQYKDKRANDLTRCIIDFLNLSEHFAEPINIISSQYEFSFITTSMHPGAAGISATISGRSVKIQVKIGRDKQSPDQVRYQHQIEISGVLYVIATSFEQFLQWYNATFEATL